MMFSICLYEPDGEEIELLDHFVVYFPKIFHTYRLKPFDGTNKPREPWPMGDALGKIDIHKFGLFDAIILI